MPTVVEDQSVDGSDYVGIRQTPGRGDEMTVEALRSRSDREFLPCAIHDLPAGVQHRVKGTQGSLDIRSDMLLITKDDVADGDRVLDDIVPIPALSVEVFEFVLDGYYGDGNTEAGDEVRHQVLIIQVVAENYDMFDLVTLHDPLQELEDTLRSMGSEGVTDHQVLAILGELPSERVEVSKLLQTLLGLIFDLDEIVRGDVKIEMAVVFLQRDGSEARGLPVYQIQVHRGEVGDLGLKLGRISIPHKVFQENGFLVMVVSTLAGVLTVLADIAPGYFAGFRTVVEMEIPHR